MSTKSLLRKSECGATALADLSDCSVLDLQTRISSDAVCTGRTRETGTELGEALSKVLKQLEQSNAARIRAQDAVAVQDQFTAVLAHDLRNSLQSINFSAEQIKCIAVDARSLEIVHSIERSCERMSELVRSVLDLARTRIGSGFHVVLKPDDRLADELRHAIGEVQFTHPARTMVVNFAIGAIVSCDRHRLAQLLGNLLANAISHGSHDHPIVVGVRGDDTVLEIEVINGGLRIDPDKLDGLFDAFSQNAAGNLTDGLGLGLFIAAQIAMAHHGTLKVTSDSARTSFKFCMPVSGR